MASYSSRVRLDIARWQQAGLIDAPTADVLTRDVEANERKSLSFGSILAMMAALLFGAAILIFIAANWEVIPRLVRVAALFAVILAGYVGGAVLKMRDHAAIGEALWIVAAAAFGGSIALIGQMYHLSGDEASAVVTWGAGTALAAVALRSNPLTVAAVGIADAWLFLKGFEYRAEFPHLFVVMALVLFAVSFWTRSQAARHLIILSVLFYLVLLVTRYDTLQVAIPLVVASVLLFIAAIFAARPVDRILQLGGRLPLHALIGFLTGLAMIQFELADESSYSSGFAIASAVALAGIVAAIVLGGRESRGLRWVAYAGFAFELAIIYVVMLQSMLDTAGFFLAAAVLLAVLAFIIIRIEKRMNAPDMTGAAA
ncbi:MULTISPECIES: DUF2157 domain-containing protein [unclassified Mesorhizobium]|uniref:DUF2157 domain-containing protein n=1 Tax=unclassified Mesorhizobium TaxID=325217 RepID=UPI003337D79A